MIDAFVRPSLLPATWTSIGAPRSSSQLAITPPCGFRVTMQQIGGDRGGGGGATASVLLPLLLPLLLPRLLPLLLLPPPLLPSLLLLLLADALDPPSPEAL